MPNFLLVDASGDVLTLAVGRGDALWSLQWPAGAAASAQALQGVDSLLKSAGLGLRELDAVAYGRGPGAFTGLRTACAMAQGLALGAHLPLVGVDTLAAVLQAAWPHWQALRAQRPEAGLTLWAVNDARMGEVYASAWHLPPQAAHLGQAQLLQAPRVCTPQLWLQDWAAHHEGRAVDALAGSAVRVFEPQWAALERPRFDVRLDAQALLVLARHAFLQGDVHDAAEAAPLYVRDKVAQTVAERLAQAGRPSGQAPAPAQAQQAGVA
jgi:tRNA threonylcarbamoyladenosine biosynthesis protein TsaB